MLDFIMPIIAFLVVIALVTIIGIWMMVFFMSLLAYFPVLFKGKAKKTHTNP